jgi:hypothetical protein
MKKYHIPIIVITTMLSVFLFVESVFIPIGLFNAVSNGTVFLISLTLFSALFAYLVIIQKWGFCWIPVIFFTFAVLITSPFSILLMAGGIIAIILGNITRSQKCEQSTRASLAIASGFLLLFPSFFLAEFVYDPINAHIHNAKVKEYIAETYSEKNYEAEYAFYYWYDAYHIWKVYDRDSEHDVYFKVLVSKRREGEMSDFYKEYGRWETGEIRHSIPSSCYYDKIKVD